MEDVLDVYQRPFDEKRPLVCLDEASKQLLSEARPALPLGPGQFLRQDSEYVRNGTASLFMVSAPLLGWRHVEVTDQRTRKDFAQVILTLVDEQFAQAQKIVLVMDNLNTHGPASLYEAFAPAEAKRLADKLEIHYTPKHGSWLNMAEIEAEHGRNRTVRACPPVPCRAHGQQSQFATSGGSLARAAQRQRRQDRLAVYDR
jgi:hypothetical protein